jgi:hypothetical protein
MPFSSTASQPRRSEAEYLIYRKWAISKLVKNYIYHALQAQLHPRFVAKAWLPFKMARGTRYILFHKFCSKKLWIKAIGKSS